MKRVLFWTLTCVLGVQAGLVEETKSRPVLAGAVVLAPFETVSAKVTNLGATINNPLVPMLVCTALQQQLTQTYGAFRSDAPMGWLSYVQTPAFDIAATNDDRVAVADLAEIVFVYPSVDKAAGMLLNNPGSTKTPDGAIRLLPSETRPKELYARFTADGRHCAFASSAALAAQALADFAKVDRSDAPGGTRPLATVSVTTRGLTVIASHYRGLDVAVNTEETEEKDASAAAVERKIQEMLTARNKRQMAQLGQLAGIEMTLDLDAQGLSVVGKAQAKPGRTTATAGFRLPAGAFDRLPSSAMLFGAGSVYDMSGYASAADFTADRTFFTTLVECLPELAAQDKSKSVSQTCVVELKNMLVEALSAFPVPAATDWEATAVVCDAARHPALVSVGERAASVQWNAVGDKMMARLAAWLEKVYPKTKFLTVAGAGDYRIDCHAVIDHAGAQAGIKPTDAAAKDLADGKKNLADILGGATLQIRTTGEGTAYQTTLAYSGFKPAAGGMTPEARLAAALPEVAKERPSAAFYATPYAFVRDVVLPIVVKLTEKETSEQCAAMMKAMTPAAANSAWAGATWNDADGSIRFVSRITSNELKNFGAAFNAFTAASMSAALSGDDAEEDAEDDE